MDDTLIQFARVNDRAAATSKRLEKRAIVADYLRQLVATGADDETLRLAVRFTSGRPFARTDERTLGASGRIVSDAILLVTGAEPAEYGRHTTEQGEVGNALAELWKTHAHPVDESSEPLRLVDVASAFDEIARTGQQQGKRALLVELLRRVREPREAAYVPKTIFGDMHTGVKEGLLVEAIADAFDREADAVRRCQLLVGDLEAVAILARDDQLASAAFKPFHPIGFMLATPQEDAAEVAGTIEGRRFVAEDKLDGVRAQVHKQGERIVIFTRTLDRADESFPDVVQRLRTVPGDWLCDGEIVPMQDGRVLPFAHIQRRLGRKAITRKVMQDNPVAFVAFDLLWRDGNLLMDEPFETRRAALDDLAAACPDELLTTDVVETSDEAAVRAAFEQAKARGNEGLVLKDRASVYAPGRRGQHWLKLKSHLPTLDCVVTAAEHGSGRKAKWLSDYTFAVWTADPHDADADAELVNVGKAYIGVTDDEIARLTELFKQIATGQRGRVYDVPPRVVLEIAMDQIQKSDRHASGFALRFPRIKRIRWDKRPEDADTLGRVEAVWRDPANTSYAPELAPKPDPQLSLFD